MKKRNMLVAGLAALATTIVVSGVVGGVAGMGAVAPEDAPVATHSQNTTNVQNDAPVDAPADAHSQHSAHVQNDAPGDAESVPTAGPAAVDPTVPAAADPTAPSAAASAGAVGPPASRTAPGASAGAPVQQIWVEPLPDMASDGARPDNGKPQSLGEALAQPHGVAAAGVTPEGAGVNDGTTKQASGLTLRSLKRGEQDAGVNDAARTGGCAPGYGDGRSCLPVAPPSAAQHAGHHVEVVWTCDELLTLFPQGIPLQVRGVDPLGLDKDGNGIACA